MVGLADLEGLYQPRIFNDSKCAGRVVLFLPGKTSCIYASLSITGLQRHVEVFMGAAREGNNQTIAAAERNRHAAIQ